MQQIFVIFAESRLLAGAMLCLAFVHNILRRHRACNALLNRENKGSDAEQAVGNDPYLESEADPAHSRAIESSLWEVKSLCNHYYVQAGLLSSPFAERHNFILIRK